MRIPCQNVPSEILSANFSGNNNRGIFVRMSSLAHRWSCLSNQNRIFKSSNIVVKRSVLIMTDNVVCLPKIGPKRAEKRYSKSRRRVKDTFFR